MRTLLPFDDCLYVLQATVPNLTRSSLHRCLQRHVAGGGQTPAPLDGVLEVEETFEPGTSGGQAMGLA